MIRVNATRNSRRREVRAKNLQGRNKQIGTDQICATQTNGVTQTNSKQNQTLRKGCSQRIALISQHPSWQELIRQLPLGGFWDPARAAFGRTAPLSRAKQNLLHCSQNSLGFSFMFPGSLSAESQSGWC